MTGRIYHIVNKTTGVVVKVGSTIRSLDRRFIQYDGRYKNYFIREVKVIESSEFDWYDPEDPFCPFLWHLVASEHMEILKQGTFRKSGLSNRFSPLDQKYFRCFGTHHLSAEGGRIGGAAHVKSGHLQSISSKGGKSAGPTNGRKNGLKLAAEKRGVCAPGVAAIGGKKSGPVNGRLAVEMGWLASYRTSEHQSKAVKQANHNRWHVKRNIVNQNCSLCKGKDASSPTSNS